MLKFLLEKEFKQLLRGGMLPGILIMMPLMMMGLFPWAANMEMRNINVTVVDNDHSSYSSRLDRESGCLALPAPRIRR